MIKGQCDPRFKKIKDIFSYSLENGFETGAALAIVYKDELVVNL